FFFFQAEDGIRDLIVTGVSDVCSSDLTSGHFSVTWVLLFDARRWLLRCFRRGPSRIACCSAQGRPLCIAFAGAPRNLLVLGCARSEERRVGKACRSRCWLCH